MMGSGPVSGGNPYHMHSSTGIMILFLALERVQNNAPKNRLCALVASHPPDPHFVHDMFPTEIRNAGAHLKFTPTMSDKSCPRSKWTLFSHAPFVSARRCFARLLRFESRQMLVEFFRAVRNMISYVTVTSNDIYDSLFSVLDLHGFSDMILYWWCSCWGSCIKLCIDDNNMTPMPYHLPPAFASCPMFYVLWTLHYIPK